MAIGLYNQWGRVLESCGEWGPAGNGVNGHAFRAPQIYLMSEHYHNQFDAAHDDVNTDFGSAISTSGATSIGHYAVARADVTNPRMVGRQMMADVTLLPNVPTSGVYLAMAIFRVEGVIVAIDILEPNGASYVQRPIFYFDRDESMQMPYTIDGFAISLSFPSGVVYTF